VRALVKRQPKEAWAQTSATWKPELLFGCVGGGLSVLILVAAGWPEDPLVSAVIPIASVIVAAVLVPVVQFLWRLLWQPWNDLRSQVDALARDGSTMQSDERLIVVLRDYLRQGNELEAIRTGSSTYTTFEVNELEDWTSKIVGVLVDYATKAQCELFIDAHNGCGTGYAAHREWARARMGALEKIIAELDTP
jgi:hypothetical protein